MKPEFRNGSILFLTDGRGMFDIPSTTSFSSTIHSARRSCLDGRPDLLSFCRTEIGPMAPVSGKVSEEANASKRSEAVAGSL